MEKHLKAAEIFATLLDSKYSLFGFKFGINTIIDIIPEVGDILATVLSLYLIWIAIKMKLPALKIAHMLWNIFINFIIGLIPFLGDIVYIFRKSNLKNYKILKEHADNSI
ncbi:MAG TPA: DUF4112 domain-containing protein [Candidatus Saccharimonadales bacterium]|nr:DUF4112 domain-containing protein [Candidatus Saccharimonadales bacterium]